MGRQPRAHTTHSLVSQPQPAPRGVTGFRTLDGRRNLELDFSAVSGREEVFAEMDGSPLGALWNRVACHGGRRCVVRSLEQLTEVRRNND